MDMITLKFKALVFALFITSVVSAQISAVEKIVQANLDAYNNRDIDTFMSFISDDIEMFNMGECESYMKGKEEIRARYQSYFEASPDLHSDIKNRMVFGNKVIDYEHITGSNGNAEPFEMIFIYEVEEGKIIKTTALRK